MSVEIIVAYGRNRVIGVAGELPWSIPRDLRRFKEITTGHSVIMGRKTYESIPDQFRPLPGRTNIVMTRNPDAVVDDRCIKAATIEEAIEKSDSDPVFVIGGGEIYELALPLADRILVTQVEGEFEGDCYFPDIGPEWQIAEESELNSENGVDFRYLTYKRKEQ